MGFTIKTGEQEKLHVFKTMSNKTVRAAHTPVPVDG